MSRLNKIAEKSQLMNIDITYNGKRYRFNLYEELQVKETNINRELKSHASSYSFLTQLRSYLIEEYDLLEAAKTRTYNQLYKRYKGEKSDITNRVNSDDLAKAKAEAHKDYKLAIHRWLKAKLHKNIIDNACKAFESRAFLIQTLSANIRKEL
jgi:hypothetical protein